MAKADKEKCVKCLSDKFAVSKDSTARRHCSNCHHVWLPMNDLELKLQSAKEEISRLKSELDTARKLHASLTVTQSRG